VCINDYTQNSGKYKNERFSCYTALPPKLWQPQCSWSCTFTKFHLAPAYRATKLLFVRAGQFWSHRVNHDIYIYVSLGLFGPLFQLLNLQIFRKLGMNICHQWRESQWYTFWFSTGSEDDVADMQTKSQYKSHVMMIACKGNKRITKIVVVSLLKYIKLLDIPGECYLIFPN
jgi:hypothetical protein